MEPIQILFGSQTGTAEYAAFTLARLCSIRWIPVNLWAIDEFNLQLLPRTKLIIFIVATTGQGEPTTNMEKFWSAILNPGLPKNVFGQVKFTVFGLGDSGYPDFCVIARQLWARMEQLGANGFYPKGLGDDQHDMGYESEFDPWIQGLWPVLAQWYTLGEPVQEETIYTIQRDLTCDLQPITRAKYTGIVAQNNILVNDGKTVNHIVINCSVPFTPGDALSIFPQNLPEEVESIIKLLSLNPDEKIALVKNESSLLERKISITQPLTIRDLLEKHLDIHRPVSRYFIDIISRYSTDVEQEKLQELASSDGIGEYARYVTGEARGVSKVLWDFDSAWALPFEWLVQGIGEIRPREYSIAGQYEGILELLVAETSYLTITDNTVAGLCSSYIQAIKPGDSINFDINPGKLRLNTACDSHIFVATGTGIAPLRSLIQHALSTVSNPNIILFFGCRSREHYLLAEFWEELEKAGKITIFPAFSREGDKKVYVQHKIREQVEVVGKALQNGWVYVCGSSKFMPESVQESIEWVLQQTGVPNPVDKIREMKRFKRYQTETW